MREITITIQVPDSVGLEQVWDIHKAAQEYVNDNFEADADA
jgi:hypothetical protein